MLGQTVAVMCKYHSVPVQAGIVTGVGAEGITQVFIQGNYHQTHQTITYPELNNYIIFKGGDVV